MAKSIRQLKGVNKVFTVLGRYDVVVELKTSNYKEVGSTVLMLGKIPGIVFTETLLEIQH